VSPLSLIFPSFHSESPARSFRSFFFSSRGEGLGGGFPSNLHDRESPLSFFFPPPIPPRRPRVSDFFWKCTSESTGKSATGFPFSFSPVLRQPRGPSLFFSPRREGGCSLLGFVFPFRVVDLPLFFSPRDERLCYKIKVPFFFLFKSERG